MHTPGAGRAAAKSPVNDHLPDGGPGGGPAAHGFSSGMQTKSPVALTIGGLV